jgi:multimeric flavodoxin WrbA
MKLIAIIGSPRGMQGNTGLLVAPILTAAQQEGVSTEFFSLADLTVLPCKGCQNICHVTGACHQKDDFNKIKAALLEADGIIFASPNYTLNVTANMKALLDRCNLMLHCQQLRGKYGAVVATSGGSDPEVVVNYLNSVITMQGMWKVGSVTAVRAQLQDADENKNLMQAAADIGRRMAAAIKNRATFPEQEEERNQAFEIMKFMVMMLQDEWPFAWNYWNTHWNMAEAS